MAPTPFSAIALDLEFTAGKQQQCSQALRALAQLTAPIKGPAEPAPLQLGDLHALLSVIADQSLLLATEAQDNLQLARRHCA